jgi:hydrogenase maturation factor
MSNLPIGKLPPDQLARLLGSIAPRDPAVWLGPGVGHDCAVIDLGADQLLVAKTDPITFASDEIGWYAVHVNANDVATTGAAPRWFMATVLLPTAIDHAGIQAMFDQMRRACAEIGASIVGGHTEITADLHRPIVIGTLLGLVSPDRLVVPTGAQPGDALILTKRLAVEATSIIAREKAADLRGAFDAGFLARCRDFLHRPGIAVTRDAQIALQAGRVHAMHDPTEGGLATALYELALASAVRLEIEVGRVPIYDETRRLCDHFGLDVWGVIASGALLMAADAADAQSIVAALASAGVEAGIIGRVGEKTARPEVVSSTGDQVRYFAQDEIARLFL